MRRCGFEDLVAAGIVLTGGTAKMEGAVELAEEIFHIPVRLASPVGVHGMEDILGNPVYATAQGLLLYARQNYNGAYSGQGEASRREPQPIEVGEEPGLVERMKSWFQGNF